MRSLCLNFLNIETVDLKLLFGHTQSCIVSVLVTSQILKYVQDNCQTMSASTSLGTCLWLLIIFFSSSTQAGYLY